MLSFDSFFFHPVDQNAHGAHINSATLKRNFPVSLEADLPQVLSCSPPLAMQTHTQLAIGASKPTCDQLINEYLIFKSKAS